MLVDGVRVLGDRRAEGRRHEPLLRQEAPQQVLLLEGLQLEDPLPVRRPHAGGGALAVPGLGLLPKQVLADQHDPLAGRDALDADDAAAVVEDADRPAHDSQRLHAQLAETGHGRERTLRSWQDLHAGVITNRKEYQAYRWPSPEEVSIAPVEYAATRMPPGMKVMLVYMGVFEDLKQLMGFEPLAYATADDPELIDDILEQLTGIAEYTVGLAAAHPATGAVFYAEDMGFNSGTLLSPAFMKEHVIPRQKRIADACHHHGKPFLLHSCGNVIALMDDFIDVVGIDAKHSFEDKILPVEEWYARWGDRISIIGGVDMDLLSRGSEGEVRARTRQILEACAPGGGYCMGSGNTAANYVKLENYYAMIDETRRWNQEHGY